MAQLQSTSITGSLIVTQGITGSFSGSISNATSASYAATASYALNAGDSVWTGSAGNIYYNGGNVGIGTTTPYQLFTVNKSNSAGVGGYMRLENTVGGAGANVGIDFATYSPEYYGVSGPTAQIKATDITNYAGRLDINVKETGPSGALQTLASFNYTGNVGIGNTSPTQKLDVTGYIRATSGFVGNSGLYLWGDNSSGAAGLFVTTAGNVGIGNNSPQTGFKLDVNGSTVTRGEIYSNSDIIGFGANENYRIAESGNTWLAKTTGAVGIGITSPSSKLHVTDTSNPTINIGTLNGNTGNAGIQFFSGTGGSNNGFLLQYIKNGSTDRFGFIDGGSAERLTILNGGNVGIGTTSPDTKLHVFTTSNSDQELLRLTVAPANSSGAKPKAILGFYTPAEANTANYTSGRITSKFDISGYANSRVTIESLDSGGNFIETLTAKNGNVGIGTTNPTGQLTVAKQYSSYTPGEYLLKLRGGNGGIYDLVDAYYDSDAAIFRVGYAGLNNSRAVINGGTSAGGASLSLVYGSTLATFITADGTSYFNGGNVGIGTTTPTAKLDVRTDTGILVRGASSTTDGRVAIIPATGGRQYGLRNYGSSFGIIDESADVIRQYFHYDGNTGFNTSSPQAKLEVNTSTTGSAGDGYALRYGSNQVHYWNLADQWTSRFQIGSTLGNWQWENSGGTRMVLDANGNVGIGTTSPSQKLETVGIIKSSGVSNSLMFENRSASGNTWEWYSQGSVGSSFAGLYKNYNTAGTVLAITDTGNVGINTTNPGYKLDVNGSARVNQGGVNGSGQALIVAGSGDVQLTDGGSVFWGAYDYGGSTYIRAYDDSNIMYFYLNGTNMAYFRSDRAYFNVNVGIGTASPASLLHIYGSGNTFTRYTNTSNSGHYIDIGANGAGESFVYGYGAYPLLFGTNGSERMRITSGGNVGIGTTNPYSKLEITSTNIPWGEGVIINPPSSGYASVFYRVEGTSGSTYTGTWALGKAYSGDGGGEVLQVVKNGLTGSTGYRVDALQQWKTNGDSIFGFKVGIGTTNPTVPLQVNGAGGDTTPILRIIGSAAQTFNWASTTEHASLTAGQTSIHLIGKANSQYNQAYFGYRHVSDGSSSNMVTIGMYASDYLLNILGNGNVGIGTTAPTQKFVVSNGSAEVLKVYSTGEVVVGSNYIYAAYSSGTSFYSQGAASFRDGIRNDTATYLKVDGGTSGITYFNGSVGIGVTNPSAPLTFGKAVYGDPSFEDFYRIKFQDVGGIYNDIGIGQPAAGSLGFNVAALGYISFNEGTNGERVRIAAGGNVGIGTTTPAVTLQVDASGGGLIRATRTSAGSGYIQMEADGTNGTLAANNILYLNAGGSTKMTVLSGGNVGIGTTSPLRALHVVGGVGTAQIQSTGTSSHIYFGDTNSSVIDNQGMGSVGDNLWFSAGGFERMRITSSGNVGIGTTEPQKKLEVITAASNFASVGVNTIVIGEWTGIHFGYREANSFYRKSAIVFERTGGAAQGKIHFLNNIAADNSSATLSDSKMVISDSGNVGIGSTAPGYKLEVNGTFGTSGTAVFNGSATYINSSDIIVGNNSTDAVGISGNTMYFPGNGSVGIGTTNPGGKVTITTPSGYDGTILRLQSTAEPDAYNFYVNETVTSGVVRWAFNMSNNGTYSNMMVFDRGNVGIGTTSPVSLLNLASTFPQLTLTRTDNASSPAAAINFSSTSTVRWQIATNNAVGTGFEINQADGSTNRFYINTSGDVGIGTASPGARLDIVGPTLGATAGNQALNTIFNNSNANTSILEIKDVRTSNGSDWTSSGKRIQMRIDSTYMGYMQFNGTGNNYGLSFGTGGTTSSPGDVNEVMRITSTGNVGIGTTSPSAKLHTDGTTKLGGGTLQVSTDQTFTTNYSYTFRDAVGINNPNSLSAASATTVMSIGSMSNGVSLITTGNVGIGTTNPTKKLHVASSANEGIFMEGTANGGHWFDFKSANSNLWSMGAQPGLMGWYNRSDSSYKMVITDGGNVGINTTSPSYKLHVESSTNAAVAVIGASGYQTSVELKGADRWYRLISQPTAGNGGRFDIYDQTGGAYRLSINTDGNVGIGTTSPQNILHVLGSASTPTTSANNGIFTIQATNGVQLSTGVVNASPYGVFLQTKDQNNAGPYNYPLLLNPTNGNVGIGTTSPSRKFVVTAAANDEWVATFTNTGTNPYGLYIDTSTNSGTAYSFATYTNAGTGVFILNNGNVGIGTISPSHKLTVTGDGSGTMKVGGPGVSGNYTGISLNGSLDISNYNILSSPTDNHLYINRPTGNNIYFRVNNNNQVIINSSGNVGIGTDSPGVKLEVVGAIRGGSFPNSTTNSGEAWFGRAADRTLGTMTIQLGGSSATNTFFEIVDRAWSKVMYGLSGEAPSDSIRVTSSGNVGLGTGTPSYKLDVATGNDNAIRILNSLGSNNNGIALAVGSGTPWLDFYGGRFDIKYNTSPGSWNSGSNIFLSILSSGNVGIGTTSPNALLHVAGTIHSFPSTTDGILQASQAGSSGGLTTVVIRSNGVSYFNGGNVGIGVTAPAAKLQVSGSSNVLNVRGSGSAVTSSIFSVDGNNGRLFEVSDDLSNSLFSVNTIAGLPVIEAFADYTVTMGTYGAYSLQVTGSRVGVGTSSPGYPLHVSGSVSGISIYATNDIAAFSDQSVKTDLQVIDSAVDRIKQINGYTYVRVDDLSNTRRAGVIAQEVQKVLPEVVSENSDGTLNVAYSNMIALLIEGMKEQQAQIDKLREDLEDLRYEL